MRKLDQKLKPIIHVEEKKKGVNSRDFLAILLGTGVEVLITFLLKKILDDE